MPSYANRSRPVLCQFRRGDSGRRQTLQGPGRGRARRRAHFFEAVQVGLDQLDRGEGIEVIDILAFLDQIEAEVEAEFTDRAA